MNTKEIIQLLKTPHKDTVDAIQTKERILAEAPITELLAAVQASPTPLIRQIVCDLLGRRADARAVPVLIDALHDADAGVRGSAADSLAKIGDPSAGEALMEQYFKEDDDIRQLLAIALGAVHYRPAIPVLIQALSSPTQMLRQCVAWALRNLKAPEAREALQQALAQERDPYTSEAMREALKAI
jgi:HEAT repeat protein